MVEEQLAAWLISAGPVGVFCFYLIWRQRRDDKATSAERAERLAVDRDRIETDKALAAALATLVTMVKEWQR